MDMEETSIDGRVLAHVNRALWLRRMTKADLARGMNTDPATVIRLLKGQQRLLVKHLGLMADALGVEPDELVTGEFDLNDGPAKAAV